MFDFFSDISPIARSSSPPPFHAVSTSSIYATRWTIDNWKAKKLSKKINISYDSSTYSFKFQQPQPLHFTITVDQKEKSEINQIYFIELTFQCPDPLKTTIIYSPFIMKASDEVTYIETLIPTAELDNYNWDNSLIIDIRFSDSKFDSDGAPLLAASSIPKIVQPAKYAGIMNYGSTCYMNIILQSLFHLPKFRKIIYETENPGVVTKELQRIFGFLQTSYRPVSTKSLIQAFGWDDSLAFRQQDAQEFHHVFLDRIIDESSYKSQIKKLFCGKFANIIKCTNANYETQKIEKFYYLQLQVRNCGDISNSFREFLAPQKLDGPNQYNTTEFGLQDAIITTSFVELPPVLNIHLQRFTNLKVKINDRLSFPEFLDLSPFIDSSKIDSRYILFSVLVHCGSATNGHYLAYIKPNPNEDWYEFNDSNVQKSNTKHAINGNFGGASSNAYMLVYVQQSKISEIFINAEITEQVSELLKAQIPSKISQQKEVQSHDISLFTEDCFKEMVLIGPENYDFINTPPKIKIPEKCTTNHLYRLVATFLNKNIDDIRIFKISKFFLPTTYIQCSDSQKLQKCDKLFVQYISPISRKIESSNSATHPIPILIKFFFPNANPQSQFIGSLFVDPYSSVSQISSFIMQALHSTTIFPIRVYYDNITFFRELNKLDEPFLKYGINESSMFLVEAENPDDLKNIDYKTDKREIPSSSIVNYFSMIRPDGDKTAAEYLQRHVCQITLEFCRFTEPSTVVATALVPDNMKVTELPSLIIFSTGEKIDVNKDTLQVFRRRICPHPISISSDSPNTNSQRNFDNKPENRPYFLSDSTTIKNLFVSEFKKVSAFKSLRLFYDIVYGFNSQELTKATFRLVDFYDYPVQKVRRFRFPMRIDESLSDIKDHIKQRINTPGNIRVLITVDNGKKLKCPEDSDFIDESTLFRAEVIPHDQEFMGPDEFLITIALYTANNKKKEQIHSSTPQSLFLFKVIPNEPFHATKMRLEQINFVPHDTFHQIYFLLKEKNISDIDCLSNLCDQDSTLSAIVADKNPIKKKVIKKSSQRQKNSGPQPVYEDKIQFFLKK